MVEHIAMESLEAFCRQVRARSCEHRDAMCALRATGVIGQMVSILRQELDSMVRVIFLLSQPNRAYRHTLLVASVRGERWTRMGSKAPITDREMVELSGKLHGWTASVYKFGCAFIHLSNLHDYRTRDPFLSLPMTERATLLGHLRYYHGGPNGQNPTFDDLVPFIPSVFEKVASNLECYLGDLEAGRDLS